MFSGLLETLFYYFLRRIYQKISILIYFFTWFSPFKLVWPWWWTLFAPMTTQMITKTGLCCFFTFVKWLCNFDFKPVVLISYRYKRYNRYNIQILRVTWNLPVPCDNMHELKLLRFISKSAKCFLDWSCFRF